MPTVIKKTPEGRDVIRFRFESDEETPPMRKPVITLEARALVCEALGLSDSGSLVLGELADSFHDCPSGSACGRYLGSEGTVLHVVGPMAPTDSGVDEQSAAQRLTNWAVQTFDADNPPDGTPGRDELVADGAPPALPALLTAEAEELRHQLEVERAQHWRSTVRVGELVRELEELRGQLNELRAGGVKE